MIAPKALALVALGGALGASARYVTTVAMQLWLGRSFPWGTLSVNVLGSFLMGIAFVGLASLGEERAVEGRLLLMTGVLGGFTTFSAFSLETLALMEQGGVGAWRAQCRGERELMSRRYLPWPCARPPVEPVSTVAFQV